MDKKDTINPNAKVRLPKMVSQEREEGSTPEITYTAETYQAEIKGSQVFVLIGKTVKQYPLNQVKVVVE